jgi:SAM-dependent methyltransferase
MTQGEKLVWLFVAALAAILFLAEFMLVEDGALKLVICGIALAVIGFALWKQRQEEHGKRRCALFLLDNQLAKLRLAHGDLDSDGGMAHDALALEESLSYIDWVYGDYLKEAGIGKFHGKIAEIGPGDNCGVALRFAADGADQVDLVDRFYSKRNESKQSGIYRALIARDNIPGYAGLDREGQFPHITRYYGAQASAEQFFADHGGYDFIVSRAVMEHVANPTLSIQRMISALKPGGTMIHVVDLKDHGMFTAYNFHELKFLEIPEWIYPEMTRATGRPNREPLSTYRKLLPGAAIKITSLVGGERLEPIEYDSIPSDQRDAAIAYVRRHKKKLDARFQKEDERDLAVSGFIITWRRPYSA